MKGEMPTPAPSKPIKVTGSTPERPPRGKNHVVFAPTVPPPRPIDHVNDYRRTLVVVPTYFIEGVADGVRLVPRVASYLASLHESRRLATIAGARTFEMNALAWLDEDFIDETLRSKSVEPSARMFVGRRPKRTANDGYVESRVIAATAQHAATELHSALCAAGIGGLAGITALDLNVRTSAPAHYPDVRREVRVTLSGPAWARVFGDIAYNETIFLVRRKDKDAIINFWGRNPRGWVVVFR
jgi:hypothetical protein